MNKLHLIYKYSDDSNQMSWGYEDVPWGLIRRHQSNSRKLHFPITVQLNPLQCTVQNINVSWELWKFQSWIVIIYHQHMFSVQVISTWSYCHGSTMGWMHEGEDCTWKWSGRGMRPWTLMARRSCDGSSMAHCDGRAMRKRWITIFCLTKPRRVRAYMLPSPCTKILTNLISKPTS